jgi:signal transduction histidine kinase
MTVYHIPTVYLIVAVLYILLPLVVAAVLSQQKSITVKLWCLGGGFLALGLLLIGLRSTVSTWVTYPLANALSWIGISLQALALRHTMDKSWPIAGIALVIAFWLTVFEYLRQVIGDPVLRFAWAIGYYVLIFSYISYLGWRISIAFKLISGRWLAYVYALATLTLFIRVFSTLFHWSEPDAVADGVQSAMTVINGLLISVVGNFTFVSLFLERATMREIEATEQRVRQEENSRLGEQIAQLQRQHTLGTMSYSFAHELSQPLTAILMDTQTIKSRIASGHSQPNEILESISEIESSTYRTVNLVERIRNFIRPTQSQYELVDLKVLLRDVASLLAFDINKQKIQLCLDLDESPCWVYGDRIQLSQIVVNVYRNAFDAMSQTEKKVMSVSLERLEERIVLRIRDSGLGVDPKLRDKVGQPFVTSKKNGMGVGLSISKTIAELHSGSLSISNAVDGGAIVELNLPAIKP